MRLTSWDAVGLSRTRMAFVVLAVGAAAGASVLVATLTVLGNVSALLALAMGALASYVVAGYPKRSLDRSAVVQAREAPVLAASAAIYLESTGSRSKTVMMLRSDEPRLSGIFDVAKKATLLGNDASAALPGSEVIRADSVSGILGSVIRAQGSRLHDEGEELEGIVRASLSAEETKFPVFLTVSFFLPIMLMLVVAIGHHDDLLSVVSLAFVEVVALDLALSFASAERKRLSA